MNKDFWKRIDRLEELARKATQEDWNCIYRFDEWENYVGPEEWVDMGRSVCICRYGKDASYIAAANPAVILEMIEAIHLLSRDISTLKMDKFAVQKQAERMARTNMELHKDMTQLEDEAN